MRVGRGATRVSYARLNSAARVSAAAVRAAGEPTAIVTFLSLFSQALTPATPATTSPPSAITTPTTPTTATQGTTLGPRATPGRTNRR
jgi:hypothetical protein